jgi:hypothetical protein
VAATAAAVPANGCNRDAYEHHAGSFGSAVFGSGLTAALRA